MIDEPRWLKFLDEIKVEIKQREDSSYFEETSDCGTNNEILTLPLDVGDVVYAYMHSYCPQDGIAPYQITNIIMTKNKKGIWTKKYRAMQVVNGKTIDKQINFSFDEIGEYVFLSQRKAETELMS